MSPPILVLAAAVAALLFWLMSDEPVECGVPVDTVPSLPASHTPLFAFRTSLLRRLFFALMGGAVVVLLAGAREPGPRSPGRPAGDPGRAFGSYMQGLLTAKLSVGLINLKVPVPSRTFLPSPKPEDLRAQAIHDFLAAVRESPSSATFRRQLGILYGFQGNLKAARVQLRRAVEIERVRGDPQAAVEARLWAQIYGRPPPPQSAIPSLRQQLDALHLGWFGNLVLATLYRGAGNRALADAAVRTAGREALFQLGLLAAAELALLVLGLCGIAGSVAFVVLASRKKLRPVPAQFHIGPAPLWEAFILYMFLFALPALSGLVWPALRRANLMHQSSTYSLTLTILFLIASDALALLAVLYLWIALARRGLPLAEVGLHSRELAANIGVGLAAYVMSVPWVIAIAVIAQRLGERFLRDVAPPFHPLEALTAGAHEWWVRFLLFAVAVIGAPFFEELFFRGALYGALRRRFGVAAGVIGSAALFAGLHPQFPIGFPPLFALGAILAGVYEWRQSLVPGMVLHAIQNSIAFLLLNLLFPPGG